MRNYLFAIVIVVSTFVSCGKDDVMPPGGGQPNNPPQNPPESNLAAETKPDVNYGTTNDPLQKMDIYLPAKRTTAATKVIFLIHGGAWMEGDKNDKDFAPVVDSIKKRLPDWAIININYRLAAVDTNSLIPFVTNKFPTQEDDIKKAIEFVYSKRSDYAISDKWVYAGASAGGHLAMLHGYRDTLKIKPKAIVNYFGPSDLKRLINEETDTWLKLGMPFLFNGRETTSSPITYITTKSSPTITFQGTVDDIVPKSQQEALHAKLKANNVPEQLNLYAGESHGFSVTTMTKTYDAVVAFLNTHVN